MNEVRKSEMVMRKMIQAKTSVKEKADGLMVITLANPAQANALSAQTVEELHALMDKAYQAHVMSVMSAMNQAPSSQQAPVRLLIQAEGKNFCGGFDFTDYQAQSQAEITDRFVRIEELLQKIRYAPFPTMACVQGAAFGAGADLVAACRFRVGQPDTRLRFPGSRFGVVLGQRHLAYLVGTAMARRLADENLLLNAESALACGLLTHLVPASSDHFDCEQLMENVLAETTERKHQDLSAWLPPNNRDQDMAALINSLAPAGLHSRIAAYLAAGKLAKH